MNKARYLVRFDDVCPTMDWDSWNKVERALVLNDIKPIMAVVPDNRDENLIAGEENKKFWSKVKSWQKMGWSIAIHGYQHLYETNDSGLLGLNKYSEFSGLAYEQQTKKLHEAIKIFNFHNVEPELWVAPAHSFDKVTVQALKDLNIEIISDGFFKKPVRHMNMVWIPQQLWKFRDLKSGIWTVCFHINGMKKNELDRICSDLYQYKKRIISLNEVISDNHINTVTLFDHAFSKIWRILVKSKRVLSKL